MMEAHGAARGVGAFHGAAGGCCGADASRPRRSSRRRATRALAAGAPARGVLARTNAALRGVERALTRPEGLRTRPWYRALIYAADENNGYSNVVFPSVTEAVRAGDRALAERELADLVSRFDAATAALVAAREALGGR